MIIKVLRHALMITGFVFVMMLVIEYINVQTKGKWHDEIKKSSWKQYILSALLGAVPGCLGAFTVVSLFSHRIVSLGSIVAAMIATSGDESFVMFATIPGRALLITGLLIVIGLIAGVLTDRFFTHSAIYDKIKLNELPIHKEEYCKCFQKNRVWNQLKNCTLQRALLIAILFIFVGSIIWGTIGPPKWNWIRVTLLITASFSLFVAITVPDHFLEEHLWEHIVKKHIHRIFFWTFGALLVLEIAMMHFNVEQWIQTNRILIILIACLVGLIPESGPHMIFVMLFARGTIPFSILLVSSIVQDGHGMLPMLAESKRGFVTVKGINFLVGIIVGLAGYAVGL